MSESKKMETALNALSERTAAGRKTTAYNVYDFMGNLGMHAGFLNDLNPEQIAIRVRRCAEDQIPMFECIPGKREFSVTDGKLTPLKGMRETYGIKLVDIEEVYLAAQKPLELPKLKELLQPFEEGMRHFRENEDE